MQNPLIFIVGSSESGNRLDLFLCEKGIAISRSQIKKMIESGHVTLDGKHVKVGVKLKTGQTVIVEPYEEKSSELKAEAIPLNIIFEDSSLIVVNKSPGMVVHPAPGHESGTLVNAIMSRVKDLKPILGELRPGIVHRLDKETSGVIVVAKDERTLIDLSRQFKDRKVEKIYYVIVIGEPVEDRFASVTLIGRSNRDRKKMSVQKEKGREASTYFRVIERFHGLSFLEAKPKTGRTHQIRVHLANLGYPVVGDKLYTKSKALEAIKSKSIRKIISNFPRQALHAYAIRFKHPMSSETISFQADIPEDMKGLLEILRR